MHPRIFIWIVAAIWVAFIVYFSVVGARAKRDTTPQLRKTLVLTLAIIAAFLLPHLPVFHFVNFAPVSPALSIAGVVLTLAGHALLVAARHTLGDNWSQMVSAKEGHELVTGGPYRYIRHPMYTGTLIALTGSAIVVGGPFVFVLLVLTPLFLWRTGAEDRLMAQLFPNEHPAYKARTKKLIPFVW
jgi:protein-S-isoprenylcysteine O-methyltransferase